MYLFESCLPHDTPIVTVEKDAVKKADRMKFKRATGYPAIGDEAICPHKKSWGAFGRGDMYAIEVAPTAEAVKFKVSKSAQEQVEVSLGNTSESIKPSADILSFLPILWSLRLHGFEPAAQGSILLPGDWEGEIGAMVILGSGADTAPLRSV